MCTKDKIVNKNNLRCSFNFVSFEQTLDEINKIKPKKHLRLQIYESLSSKETKAICHDISNSLSSSSFQTGMKYSNVRLVLKKREK